MCIFFIDKFDNLSVAVNGTAHLATLTHACLCVCVHEKAASASVCVCERESEGGDLLNRRK